MATMTAPRELFLHGLQDVYYAEQQLVKKLPTMIDEATDRELAGGFEKHLDETKKQVANLEQVFSQLGEKAKGERCPGIEGIAEEHDRFMKEHEPSPEVCDMFLTGAAARVEHYEMAAYNDLIAMAEGLDEGGRPAEREPHAGEARRRDRREHRQAARQGRDAGDGEELTPSFPEWHRR
jgi:ferritin-like metal-binding protein YciE